MTSDHRRLELDKILAFVAAHAVTEAGKERAVCLEPATELNAAQARLTLTQEAYILLFEIGAGNIAYFPPLLDKAERAGKGASLTCLELTEVARLLTSARLLYTAVTNADGRIEKMKELVSPIIPRESLEKEISDKIIGENEIADNASERLFAIRREKRLAGERIRARLSEYLTGSERKYLQEGIVTVRGDRFVVPVKAEYKRSIKGFVHDRSATGATFFIEPEEIFEMNNELLTLSLDEKEEEARILKELSSKVGAIASEIERDLEVVTEADVIYACAEYAHEIKGIKPELNQKGVLNIVKGRHPLLDKKTAVPVSVSVGEKCRFLVLSGSNTGGKTVTLKMCGLFPLMAACGLFVPALEGTRLSVFSGVYCDAGDSQSIEENLSTFSSHIVNIKEILNKADSRSLVLIDEPGGGTDPEEGQALATAVLSALVKKGGVGIVTTHYGALKEFAYEKEGLENGSM
ncbi:MAG: endonuclease MutS2, partial [Clostridia bacterium]|nr:endonuclease MutS2 [Clostridia bacterium]